MQTTVPLLITGMIAFHGSDDAGYADTWVEVRGALRQQVHRLGNLNAEIHDGELPFSIETVVTLEGSLDMSEVHEQIYGVLEGALDGRVENFNYVITGPVTRQGEEVA